MTLGSRHGFIGAAVVLAAVFLPHIGFEAAAPDFGGYRPHFQGFGVDTPGGRGGAIIRVTSLGDAGPGTLRAALEASGPRIVIFETSGTIALMSPINVANPYLTIAGQTAPSPGINIRNYPIYIDTHDVVVQHLRFRAGDTHQKEPGQLVVLGAGLNAAHHIVFDHVSLAWSMYMGFFFADYTASGPSPTNTAILDSLIAYPLVRSYAFTGMGGLYVQNPGGRHTQARNLYVHNSYRQPLVGPGNTINLVNNVIYGSGPAAQAEDYAFTMLWGNLCEADLNVNPKNRMRVAYVNNVIIPSLGTGIGDTAGSDFSTHALYLNFDRDNLQFQENRIWLSGNQGPFITGPTGSGQWDGVLFGTICGGDRSSQAELAYESEPQWHSALQFATIPTEAVPAFVFANAGARPLDRDTVDRVAVSQAQAGLVGDRDKMGSRIKSQNDMGGHPTLARTIRRLQIPDDPHAVATGQWFRTNIEMWLEQYARALEPANIGQ